MSPRLEPGPVAARPLRAARPDEPEIAAAPVQARGRLRQAAAGAAPRGVLLVLALLMGSSAVARLGFGTGLEPVRAAMAEGAAASGEALSALGRSEAEPAVPAPMPAAARVSTQDAEGIEALIEALAEREVDLDAREAALAERVDEEERRAADRVAELAAARAELEAMMGEVEAAEARLDAAIARASGAAEDDIARLTSVYESMKPKDAAALFETMEPAFSAGFLGRMRPEAAAEVMSGMTPDRAYAVSAIIAGRNARLDAPDAGTSARFVSAPDDGSAAGPGAGSEAGPAPEDQR